jgi:O-antigen/teichoic acid export membrane protein
MGLPDHTPGPRPPRRGSDIGIGTGQVRETGRVTAAVDEARGVRPGALTRQAIAVAATTGAGQLAVAAVYVLTARATSVEEFGRIVTVIALAAVLAGALDFGTNAYLTRELARGALPDPQVRDQLARRLALSLGVFLVVALAAGAFDPMYLAVLPLAASATFEQASLVPLRARGKGLRIAAVILTDKLTAVAVFLALAGQDGTVRLWVAITVGAVAGGIVAVWWSPARPWIGARLRPWRNPWDGGLHFGVFSLAVSAQSLDVPLAAAAGGANVAGLYGAVARWTAPMSLFTNAYSQVSAPVVASSRSGREALARVRATLWLPLLAVVSCLVVIAAAPWLVTILIGSEYAGATGPLRILAVAALFSVLNQPLAVFMQSRRLDRYVGVVTAAAILLQLLAITPFVLLWGAAGVAWAVVLGQALLLALLLARAVRVWRRTPAAPRPVVTP